MKDVNSRTILSFSSQKFIQKSDSDKSGKKQARNICNVNKNNHSRIVSGDVGLSEFVNYVREHEKSLRLQFSHLDKNKDGSVDLEEMIEAFKELGVVIDRDEALKLFNR